MNINWKQKLTSRKFLAAVAGIVTGIVMITSGNISEGTATVISAIAIYCAAEGLVDIASIKNIAQGVADKVDNSEITNEVNTENTPESSQE